MDVNLTFYGGEDFPRLSDGVDYNLNGWGVFAQLVWRGARRTCGSARN